MSWITLLWKYRKPVGVLAAVLIAAGLILGYGRARYNEGYAVGASEVQAKWDADAATRDAEVIRMAREHAARDAATRARNDEVINGYQKEIARIASDRDSLARRLHDYEVRLRALSEAASQPGAAGAAGESEAPRSVDAALDAYDAACRRDAARLDALIRQVQAQLDITPES
jgi:hypothetical protein